MWVTCLQENLSRGLATVGRAVAVRATLPVTQNVLLQTDNGRLKLTATNLEIAISTWIGAQIEQEGAVTEHHPEHSAGLGAEAHADADLRRPLRDEDREQRRRQEPEPLDEFEESDLIET